ncbi:hypothetical protein [Nocardia wallacei]|uniref:hypothetical protein n=1 Tax=Nocardia wallacei TaxID=480035 RepID=UPI0024562C76|nr:hypothetical protein [Nocardia wallacei]
MADEIEKIVTTTLVPVIGAPPLIVRDVSEKPKRQSLQAQHGPKPPRNMSDRQTEFATVAVDHDNAIDDTEVPR